MQIIFQLAINFSQSTDFMTSVLFPSLNYDVNKVEFTTPNFIGHWLGENGVAQCLLVNEELNTWGTDGLPSDWLLFLAIKQLIT